MPLWYVVRDGDVWVWTYAASQKVRNLERDPRATLLVEAGESYEELRGVMLRADAVIERDPDFVAALGLALYERYLGTDELPDDVRATITRQAPKRVAIRFVERSARAGITASWRRRREGPDPLRRQGHAPAPDHAHQRQAARPGRQQAGPVLRDRGDRRRRHRGDRDHHRAGDRRRDPRGGRRRLALRRADHLHRAGPARRASPTRC